MYSATVTLLTFPPVLKLFHKLPSHSLHPYFILSSLMSSMNFLVIWYSTLETHLQIFVELYDAKFAVACIIKKQKKKQC